MIRIGLNLHRVTPHSGGIRPYAAWLARQAKHLSPEFPLTLFTYPGNGPLDDFVANNDHLRVVALEHPRRLPGAVGELDVVYHIGRQEYPKLKIASVAFLPDCLEHHFPAYFSAKDLRARAKEYRTAGTHCARIVTPSAASRDDLVRLAGCPREALRVIPHPPVLTQDSAPLPPGFDPAPPFLLYPANNWPHKNHVRLLEALRLLRARGTALRLVMTGQVDPRFNAPAALATAFGLADSAVHLGQVAAPQLRALYARATALVFPSRHEGFGLPLLEAFESDLPVACAEAGSLPEVADGGALLFDPNDPDAIATALARITSDTALRRELVTCGRARLAAFAPESIAHAHRTLLEEAARD